MPTCSVLALCRTVGLCWVARLSTWGVSIKRWTAVKRAQKVAWMSNKWLRLRAVILGGNSHVDVRDACSLYCTYRVLYQLRRKIVDDRMSGS